MTRRFTLPNGDAVTVTLHARLTLLALVLYLFLRAL